MRDRLRTVECPKETIDQLEDGHLVMLARVGVGFPVSNLERWMQSYCHN